MATRIFVQCKTAEMPGSPKEKNLLMANAICQKVWKRDFIADADRLTTFGGYFNRRCMLLIDNGPVDAIEYTILQLRWNGEMLLDVSGPVHPYVQKQFETKYQFNPAQRPTPITYTDEELKERVRPEVYNKHIRAMDKHIVRRGE